MMLAGLDTTLLATTLAKGTLLLVVALAIAAALRRAPAGARHLVWLTTLATVLLFPILARWEPMRFEVLPPLGATATSVLGPTVGAPLDRPIAGVGPADASAPRAAPSHIGAGREIPQTRPFGIGRVLLLAWLAGAAVLVGWLAMGVIAVRRIVTGGRLLDDARWTTPLYEVADRMNLDRIPRILASDRVEMPFACGIWNPTIVFPASAEAWSDDRRRVVLFHELAHIRRRDLIGHALGRLACAVYWFHPLVWTAARQLRAESERACDDLVLACGAKASDYVAHLLDIVTSVRRSGAPVTALPMARKKEFEGRMLAILDPAIPRGEPGRMQSAGILALLVLITLSVAAAAPAPTPKHGAADPTITAAMPTVSDLDSPKPISIDSAPTSGRPKQTLVMRPDTERVAESVRASDKRVVQQTFTDKTIATAIATAVATDTSRMTYSSRGHGPAGTDSLSPRAEQDRIDALIRILRNDTDAEVRKSAAWGLAQTHDARVFAVLTETLKNDKDAEVREMAAWALAEHGVDAAVFIEALKKDRSEEVRETAAWALGNMDSHAGEAALLAALKDESAEVRKTATWALGTIQPEAAGAAIVAGLKDEDSDVRMTTAWALGQIEDHATLPALRAAFTTEKDNEAREAEFRAIALMGDVSEEFINEAMKSPDPELRARAVRVLAGQGTGPWPWPWPWPRPRPSP